MSLRLSSLGLALGVGAVVGLAAACQTYDFEPVEPLAVAQVTEKRTVVAQALKSNIMLVVDKSSSMKDPVNRNHPSCPSGCGWLNGDCPAGCPTLLTDMKSAMADFLGSNGASARYGLAIFPEGDTCGGGGVKLDISQSNEVDSELAAHASQVNDLIQAIVPSGGTPTGVTLQALANHPSLNQDDDRADVVLLLTDGLPNCNSTLNKDTCTCTVVDGNGNPYSPCQPDARNCLDQDRSVQVIEAMRARNIRTVVVAFGSDLGNDLALAPLNAMAEAGGFARTCGADSECGTGQTCDGVTDPDKKDGVCSVKFYQAANAAELSAALDDIRRRTLPGDPCAFTLNASPDDERFVVVYVRGEKVPSGPNSWTYTSVNGQSTVTLQGQLCTQLMNATAANPFDLEIRIVEAL